MMMMMVVIFVMMNDDGEVSGVVDDGDDGDGVKLQGTCELSCQSSELLYTQALSEFVDASETREDAVPRNILMAIMQLTEFLSKVILCKLLFSNI